jgi:hypothetical protein
VTNVLDRLLTITTMPGCCDCGRTHPVNPASAGRLPTERQKLPRYLSQSGVERLVDEMPRQYRAPSCWSAHVSEFVHPRADALVFTASAGGPLFGS